MTPELVSEIAEAYDVKKIVLNGVELEFSQYAKAEELTAETMAREDAIAELKVEMAQQTPMIPEVNDTLEDAYAWLQENGNKQKMYVLPDGYIYGYIYRNEIVDMKLSFGTLFSAEISKTTGEITQQPDVYDAYLASDLIDVEPNKTYTFSTDGIVNAANDLITVSIIEFDDDGSWLKYNDTVLGVGSNQKTNYELTTTEDTAKIRLRLYTTSNTKNKESIQKNLSITYAEHVKDYMWTNTGHAFVPADYEERIIDLETNAEEHEKRITVLETTDIAGIPDYVTEAAEAVADKVLAVRKASSFVFAAVSDLHTTGTDDSAIGITHAGMALDEINSLTQLDLVALFGDVMYYKFSDDYKNGFLHVKKSFADVAKAVPYIQMQGNHDELSTDTTEEAEQKYFAYIGANNVNTVTDWENRHRNYGYRDFESQKMRVIYLNSVDVSEAERTGDCWVTPAQMTWFVDVALDFSGKTDQENWAFIVCNHHPLNWSESTEKLLTVLDAYKNGTNGSVTIGSTIITYDFTQSRTEFIAHFHGHLHNFRSETLGENNILSITVPNACFDRNNEYGMYSGYTDNVHEKYGDVDEEGNQRQFNKTADCEEDTAFNVVVIDRNLRKIHCFNYGAGIDREIGY